MQLQEQVSVNCPYCGEPLGAALDPAGPDREFSAECPVCFCPIHFRREPVLFGRFHRVLALRAPEFRTAV